MIKDKCGNPRDEKEIFEDIFNLWMNTPDSKKDSLATMLAGGESKAKFIIHMNELCKERKEEEKTMCKENDIKEITKKLKELEELLESLKKEPSPYDRVEYTEKYYHVNSCLKAVEDRDMRCNDDDIHHSCANYMDEKSAIRKSKEMQLNFLLDKFTRENGWDDKFWEDNDSIKYYIIYDYNKNDFKIYSTFTTRATGEIYFISKEVAQEAIDKYKNLFLEVFKPNEITKEKFDGLYVGKKIAVWCATEELANEFLKKADEFGYKWNSGDKYTGRNFYHHQDICYCIHTGMFAKKQEYLDNGYLIAIFEGFK